MAALVLLRPRITGRLEGRDSPGAAAALALTIGLRTRNRWAYLAALALDGPGTAALIVLAITCFKPGRGWIWGFVTPFTLLFGFMVWRLEAAFRPKPADPDVPSLR